MEMQTVAMGVGLFVFGFLIGRLTAPKERNTTVYQPVRGRDDRQSRSGRELDTIDPEIETALAAGHKIEAIKLYRKLYGTDLKGAKDAVDTIEARRERPSG